MATGGLLLKRDQRAEEKTEDRDQRTEIRDQKTSQKFCLLSSDLCPLSSHGWAAATAVGVTSLGLVVSKPSFFSPSTSITFTVIVSDPWKVPLSSSSASMSSRCCSMA